MNFEPDPLSDTSMSVKFGCSICIQWTVKVTFSATVTPLKWSRFGNISRFPTVFYTFSNIQIHIQIYNISIMRQSSDSPINILTVNLTDLENVSKFLSSSWPNLTTKWRTGTTASSTWFPAIHRTFCFPDWNKNHLPYVNYTQNSFWLNVLNT